MRAFTRTFPPGEGSWPKGLQMQAFLVVVGIYQYYVLHWYSEAVSKTDSFTSCERS
jgi:hypothetical protein